MKLTSNQSKLVKILNSRILEGDFGKKRIISTAYESIGFMCGYTTLDSFKTDLAILNCAGYIRITRIDLVSALPSDLQEACHISTLSCGNNAILVG
jgi:hypothetical protein